ncbi:2-dehydropantoate 2-reductase [Penicillium soppii]|jgi:2-dehydropantoate 2-reductase|uniref:2-dehydropantoate 2-reductase n=1 Tax=Penicillium soppii TaxID=69789 RepID=UPI002547F3BA|nr:2-dehydropantoate 2-reductase [Penicillium soppii]KAJ5864522.1 2-dehydropantoate 2-reductase [Penicillium soppii]
MTIGSEVPQHPEELHSPNILVVGAGSVGAIYIHQLQRAGCIVSAVCRSNHDTVSKDGFTLQSKLFGNVTYKPDYVFRSTLDCPAHTIYDYIIVTTKALSGSQLPLVDLIRPIIQRDARTAIVMAQNGIAVEDIIAEAFPVNPILSGVVYLPAMQIKPGVVKHHGTLNLLELGTFRADAPKPHKVAAVDLARLFCLGGGQVEVCENIQTARWSKLVLNAAWGPICGLSLCTDGDFLTSSPFAADLVRGAMMEIVRLAQKIGIPGVDEKVMEKQFSIAKMRAQNGTGREVSMLQDIRRGQPFEIETILGEPVRLGQQHGVEMPRLETLYALLMGRLKALTGHM